ncbi:DUF2199 domain-containing protein [Acidisphaera sp. S103]|uniref:DUF2199 domain-containing protein n=1 Tax=Acidisphaera sp. S103 TaxID=1747223 RepID=UPI00131E055F|nr:DUF2199 domain-containing protein [Acidisphaera sp. S103]
MSNHFICSICGSEHMGLSTDYANKLPDDAWRIPEAERTIRAKFSSDLCRRDKRHFIRGVLHVPLSDAEGDFRWGVWTEVRWPTFERYLKLYNEDGSAEPPHAGTLANALPNCNDTLGAPVLIQFRDQRSRPSINFMPDDASRLALEQRNGINNARYHEIPHEISSRR